MLIPTAFLPCSLKTQNSMKFINGETKNLLTLWSNPYKFTEDSSKDFDNWSPITTIYNINDVNIFDETRS